MSELKAMLLVMAGAVLLSLAADVVLLSIGASGTALAVALALALCVGSVGVTAVIEHYESGEQSDERRQR
jgi:hypothetical protein